MAALWFGHRIDRAGGAVRRILWRAALGLVLVVVPGCSELAQPSDAMQPSAEPPYVALAAKHLQAALKDLTSYDAFEISPVRWVHSMRGWSWITCVHFHDHGHLRSYALLIQDNVVVDGRFAVETDACETQTYTQFDLLTGQLGRPTAPVQPPLY
ncbi:MAG: hypothetical protein ABSE22_10905 [Xanthobacteraceae bacterium]|jgi:hypothetical protein